MTEEETAFFTGLGLRIAALRRRRGVSQEELAEAIGLSRPTLSNIEKGRQGVSVYRLLLICRHLRVEMDDAMPSRPDREARPVPVTVVVTVGGRSAKFTHEF